ncbi:MAG: bifunctional 5,10-methylenetetrahydrofolate dehydrogenase/5,10-methenyltetrahydrofolate cyclohydrolase [Candidatus Omnitrophica bacterium]|nr:bifunctional 5,10-methylenetetrahydrofolate dehydrogenase/5,10-methenyltetrahydrofolate cyclohydrolase [Candidatus Omnitrophota bacterium]
MAETINGRKTANEISSVVREKIKELGRVTGKRPRLVSILVGDSHDARIYVNMQKRAAEKAGIEFVTRRFDKNTTQERLIEHIHETNADDRVTAIILQKPLPGHMDHDHIVYQIDPLKDAEGIHPYNLGKIMRREADIVPCTPGAVMKILRVENVDLYGREVVIIGHSAIVGKPLNLMMINEMATTTVCHLATSEKGDIRAHSLRADVLVVAVGMPEMVRGDWIKDGAVVVDVGINKGPEGIVGDVCFREARDKASLITPVPGGVGPVTVSILMRNVWRAFRDQHELMMEDHGKSVT